MVQVPRWQILVVIGVLLAGIIFAMPNVLSNDEDSELPSWLPSEQINLGLDLRGGSYLLLEADVEFVIQQEMENLVDSLRLELRRNNIGYSRLSVEDRGVTIEVTDLETVDQVREIGANQSQVPGELQVFSEDDTAVRVEFSDQALREKVSDIMDRTLQIVAIRLDETGTREPSIQRQGEDRVLVQLPGVRDPERIKELLGTTAKMSFRFVDQSAVPGVGTVPAGAEVLPSREQGVSGAPLEYVVRKREIVSGERLVDAQATFQDNQPVVSFRFDATGARQFGRATQENVGRLFAIVLDNEVISAPVIREPILGGNGVISGNFTTLEANDLALLLRAGALPAPLLILEERTVGPGLGADSIRAGEIACILGMIFVIVFMASIYGLFGIVANVALIANLVLIMAALSVLQATLTLPGIAGIVLTIGMAVDANVLIFERIREEARLGRGPVTAIDTGYRRALTTILDSNLTTLIAAFLLFYFGTGPVKGFAVTLSIGIITSLFTAFMVTRLLLVFWLRRRRPKALPV